MLVGFHDSLFFTSFSFSLHFLGGEKREGKKNDKTSRSSPKKPSFARVLLFH